MTQKQSSAKTCRLGWALLPFLELSDGFPELLWGHPEVLLHSLPEILSEFCCSSHSGWKLPPWEAPVTFWPQLLTTAPTMDAFLLNVPDINPECMKSSSGGDGWRPDGWVSTPHSQWGFFYIAIKSISFIYIRRFDLSVLFPLCTFFMLDLPKKCDLNKLFVLKCDIYGQTHRHRHIKK